MEMYYIALYMEADETWTIGRHEESQDAFDAMVNDLKEFIKYNVEDDNYANQEFTPDMKLVVKSDECPDFCVHIDKNGMGAQAYIDPGARIICEWKIERHDVMIINQDVLDLKKKKEEQKMKPVYATMCTEDNGIWLIGLYEEQQDAFEAMVEDLKESINYTVEEDNYSDLRLSEGTFTPGMELDAMDHESSGFCARIDKDGMDAELVTSSGRVIEWTIKQADKVNTHQDVLDSKKKEEQK